MNRDEQWEYKIIQEALTAELLNKLGNDGWEMIGVSLEGVLFKRVKQQSVKEVLKG